MRKIRWASRSRSSPHDPDQTAAVATQFNTRKSLEQQQGGLIYDAKLSDSQSVRVLGYYGHRDVLQYLSIPVATQTPVDERRCRSRSESRLRRRAMRAGPGRASSRAGRSRG